jgi:peptide/nickel transport system ATP-binding protein
MPSVPLIMEKVSKSFDSGVLRRKRTGNFLQNISFEVKTGETLGIMGESGTGKTTLAKIAAGLEKASNGKILYEGKDISLMTREQFSGFRRNVQMVFQNPESSLNPRKSLAKSLEEVADLKGISKKDRKEALSDILQQVDLQQDILSRYPHQVSGGENQRAALARVLLLEPQIVILDEPTSALDISVRAQILHLLKSLQSEKGLAYVFISHDLDVIRFMSHRISLLREGELR